MKPAPLDIRHFGATGEGDDGPAIQRALDEAKFVGVPVLVPPGRWSYGAPLNVDSAVLFGAPGAELFALDVEREAIYLRGLAPRIHALRLTSDPPTERGSDNDTCRVVVLSAGGFDVRGITIEHSCGAGVFVGSGAYDGRVRDCAIKGTLADAVHLTGGCNHVKVLGNMIIDAGDDGIAVVSYGNEPLVEHVLARRNTIVFNAGGRMMSVVGGAHVTYENNELLGNVHAAGLYIAQEDSYDTHGCSNVLFRYNLLRGAGSEAKDHPTALIFSDGAQPNERITLARNIIINGLTHTGGVRVYGDCRDVLLDANLTLADPQYRLDTEGVVVHPYISGPVGLQQ